MNQALVFGNIYRILVEELFGTELTSDYGFLDGEIAVIEQCLRAKLPLALREYYQVLGRFDRLNTAYNHLLTLDEMLFSGSMLRFMDENQSVCTWAIHQADLNKPNPPVYQGNPISNPRWYDEKLQLSEFLTLMIYQQAVWGGLGFIGDHCNSSRLLPNLDSSWAKVVDHAGLRIWRHEGMLISNLQDDDCCICATEHPSSFEYLLQELGFEPQ